VEERQFVDSFRAGRNSGLWGSGSSIFLIADPDPVLMTKNFKKTLQLENLFIFFDQKLQFTHP
jgi:hypothetical protein